MDIRYFLQLQRALQGCGKAYPAPDKHHAAAMQEMLRQRLDDIIFTCGAVQHLLNLVWNAFQRFKHLPRLFARHTPALLSKVQSQ